VVEKHMKKFILLFFIQITLLTGCSSKFAYNNIDWLMYWYIDDYVELDKSQKSLLDEHVEQWMRWHRQSELSEYKAQLGILYQQISTGHVSQRQWLDHFELGKRHWARFRDHISPELANLAPKLTDEQVNSLFAELYKQNEERIEKRKKRTSEERLTKNIEDTQDNVKQFIGKLTTVQKAIIVKYSEDFNSSFDLWINYRQRIQKATYELLMNERDEPDFPQRFLDLLSHPERFRDEKFATISQHNNQVYAAMLAELDQSLSAKQKQKALNELQNLIDDITDLQED
jgi:plasmid maintenance system antidote protein VapI